GFTGGVGLAVHTPGPGKTHDFSREVGVSALPYAAVLPFRWGMRGDVTREYCARFWSYGSNAEAQAAADALAISKAKAHVAGSEEMPSQETAEYAAARTNDKDKFLENPEEYPGVTYDAKGWKVGTPGKCWLGWLPGV